MNKVTANLVFIGAQVLLQEKYEKGTICIGLYDNHPIDVARLIVNGERVACMISDTTRADLIMNEDGTGIRISKPLS